MDQKFESLNPDDVADLEAKRSWVRDHYDEGLRHKYETLEFFKSRSFPGRAVRAAGLPAR